MPNLPPQHLKLAKDLRGKLATSPGGTRRFWAKVTAIDAGPPVTVTLQQGTLTPVPGIRYDDSYTPTVGDTVYGDAVGNDYLVIGSLDPAVSGGGGGGASGALLAANNLSDLASAATARTNLGASTVGAAVFTAASATAARSAIGAGTSSLALGTTSTTALAGNTTAAGIGAATAAQGALADSAVQPGDLATVATTGAYGDLTGKPTLGTAAAVNTGTTSGTVPVLNASGQLDMSRLASGTPDGTKFVRDDGTLATPSGGGSTPSAPTWTTPTLSGATVISGYQAPRYCTDALGFIHIEGSVRFPMSSTTTTIFTLPTGSRPPATISGPLQLATSGWYGHVEINTAGNVQIISDGGSSAPYVPFSVSLIFYPSA